jgi:hypothetical protein
MIRAGCPDLWAYLEIRLEEERQKGWFGAECVFQHPSTLILPLYSPMIFTSTRLRRMPSNSP